MTEDDPISRARAVRPSARIGMIVFAGVLLVLGSALWGRFGLGRLFAPPPPTDDADPVGRPLVVGPPAVEHVSTRTVPVTADVWPNLHGPTHDGVVPGVTGRVKPWGDDGPPEVWRVPCGTGYSAPIVWRDRVILLHRLGDEEVVSCLDAATGESIWEHRYPTAFECRVAYSDGPYGTPATDGDVVISLGVEGKLFGLKLETGDVLWERDLRAEYDVPEMLFGVGHSPLIWGDRVILNVGGRKPGCGIVAFDRRTGEFLWGTTDHSAGYATPHAAGERPRSRHAVRPHGRRTRLARPDRRRRPLVDPVSHRRPRPLELRHPGRPR